MLTCSLQSGSNGNSIYVETPDVRLLFDAGISGKIAQQRLNQHGRDLHQVDALLISHNHSDHISSAGVFQRRCSFPLYITPRTWQSCRARLAPVTDLCHFHSGEKLEFGTTTVETIPTAHDGTDGCAFVIIHNGKKLGIFTDLGHCFDGIEDCIAQLDALYLESNYDPEMLANGPYPPWLKNRIIGPGGHLSNFEAADLVRQAGKNLQLLILSHLSEHNNHPDLALATARQYLPADLPIAIAPRTSASEMFTLH